MTIMNYQFKYLTTILKFHFSNTKKTLFKVQLLKVGKSISLNRKCNYNLQNHDAASTS